MDPKRTLLRHFLAALAYRTQKALRGAPLEFATFRAAPKVRTPHDLIRHMDDVLGYSRPSLSAEVTGHPSLVTSQMRFPTSTKRSATSRGTLSSAPSSGA